MEAFQQRVVAERDEIRERRHKLDFFLCSAVAPTIPLEELDRMRRQSDIMFQYEDVLNERIKGFTK